MGLDQERSHVHVVVRIYYTMMILVCQILHQQQVIVDVVLVVAVKQYPKVVLALLGDWDRRRNE